MAKVYDNILNAKLLDEVYLTELGFHGPGAIFRSVRCFFKEYDEQRGLVSTMLDPEDRDRTLVVPVGAIKMIKSTLTGEVIYEKDYRSEMLGANY